MSGRPIHHSKNRWNGDHGKNKNVSNIGSEMFVTHDDVFQRSNNENYKNTDFNKFIKSFDYSDNLTNIDEYDDNDDDDFFHKPEESIYKELTRNTFNSFHKHLKNLFKNITKFKSINITITFIFIILILIISLFYKRILVSSSPNFTNELSFMDQPIDNTPLHKIIMPFIDELYPDITFEDELMDELSDFFDPRLTPAMLLLYIQSHLLANKGKLKKDFNIAFSWEDWVDLDQRLEYDNEYLVDWLAVHSNEFLNNIENLQNLDCKTFAMLYGCEGNKNFFSKCNDLKRPLPNHPFKFEITGPTDAKIREPGRLLYSGTYLKTHMPPPEQIYLLDVFGDNGEGSLMISVDPKRNLEQKPIIRNRDILKQFINWEIKHTKKDLKTFLKTGWNIETLRFRTSGLLNKFGVEKIIRNTDHKSINEKETYLAVKDLKKGGQMKVSSWKFDDFVWDEEEFLNELSLSAVTNELDNKLYTEIDRLEKFRIQSGYHPKYLYEAQLYGSSLGSHYDWRFFQGSLITNDYRQSIIHKLARTWLRFCFENNLKTFIAYGSMLGWIRNGLTLPWDGDIDVIVTMESLNLLARNFNQTMIIDYSSKDGFQTAMTGYLIDINPAYYSRIKGDGNNVIDGRLIDISTGIYLDITALAWSKNYLKETSINKKLKKLVDKDFEINQYFALEGDDVYIETLMDQLKVLQEEKQLIHCKNDNVYTIDELSIMIPSYFEGVRAYFPHDYEKIIWRLYPKALTRVTELDYVFDHKLRLWLNLYDCPDYADENMIAYFDPPFGTCNCTKVIDEYKLTHAYTERHIGMLEEGDWLNYELDENTESKPLRIDEFFVLYSARLGISDEELLDLYL